MGGLDVDVERGLLVPAASPGVKPKPSGDGNGVVERLFSAGLEAGAALGPAAGREPIGPTDPIGPAVGLDGCREEGESAPPGDEVEVTG